jgi:hypothetical protein
MACLPHYPECNNTVVPQRPLRKPRFPKPHTDFLFLGPKTGKIKKNLRNRRVKEGVVSLIISS